MIIDCFTFFNELDLLEGRLEYLYENIDKFIIVEANITFTGNDKPYVFMENTSRYKKYLDKIFYFPVFLDKSKYDFSLPSAAWAVEKDQRNAIANALGFFPKESHVLIGDVDEIPHKSAILYAVASLVVDWPDMTILQNVLVYGFNYKLGVSPNVNNDQYGNNGYPQTVVTTAQRACDLTPEFLRVNRPSNLAVLSHATRTSKGHCAGWHLTYWGDVENVQLKLKSFSHTELNTNSINNYDNVKDSKEKGILLSYNPIALMPVDARDIDPEIFRIFRPYCGNINHYYQNVDGWFSEEDAELYKMMVANAKDSQHYVEIGSYKGRSSSLMAVEIFNSKKSIKFDCVDTWLPNELYEDLTYDEFMYNMEPMQGYFTPVRMGSIEAAALYEDNSLDFVFIDALYDYESVKNDIVAWLPKVKINGYIGGHDYWSHDTVHLAVNHTLGSVLSIGNCFYYQKVS